MEEEPLILLLATIVTTGRQETFQEIVNGCPDPKRRNELLREELSRLSKELEDSSLDPDVPFLPSVFDDKTIEAVIGCFSAEAGILAP